MRPSSIVRNIVHCGEASWTCLRPISANAVQVATKSDDDAMPDEWRKSVNGSLIRAFPLTALGACKLTHDTLQGLFTHMLLTPADRLKKRLDLFSQLDFEGGELILAREAPPEPPKPAVEAVALPTANDAVTATTIAPPAASVQTATIQSQDAKGSVAKDPITVVPIEATTSEVAAAANQLGASSDGTSVETPQDDMDAKMKAFLAAADQDNSGVLSKEEYMSAVRFLFSAMQAHSLKLPATEDELGDTFTKVNGQVGPGAAFTLAGSSHHWQCRVQGSRRRRYGRVRASTPPQSQSIPSAQS